LVSGVDEPHFHRPKPKVVVRNNPSGPGPGAKSNVLKPPSQESNKPKVQPSPIPKFEVKAEGRDGPCSEYRLDLEGRSFGVCKCGWGRAEHNKAKQNATWVHD